MPTSRSFFLRPRLSMGNRCSIRNRRPPYTRNPTAAASDTAARKPALSTRDTRSCASVAAMFSYAQRPACAGRRRGQGRGHTLSEAE